VWRHYVLTVLGGQQFLNEKKDIMKQILFSAAVISTVLFSACNKDKKYEANGGDTQMGYQLQVANASSSGLQRSTAANITWTSGFANPEKIKFEAKQDNSKLEYEAKNVGTIDLFAPDAITFGNFTLSPGTYKEIELKMYFSKHSSEPALQLNGQFVGDNINAPILLIVDASFDIKTEQEDVVIDQGMSYIAITTLDLARYTQNVTEEMWDNATLTNGVIVISNSSNQNIYNRILSNIRDWKHKCHFWHH
jgi:hypothetical protein